MTSINLTVKDGRITTTSNIIAEHFGKLHKNVLRDIENLECSQEFNRLNFELVQYIDAKGEARPAYEITRDGFTFLAMGFTGKEAAAWKERYINAFNEMEKVLQNSVSSAALPGIRITRAKERFVCEMFVAGYNQAGIARELSISKAAVNQLLHGKYQFPHGAGSPECSPQLIAAVASRHLVHEQTKLAAMQEIIAQRYLFSNNNQELARALESVGRHLQQAPALALTNKTEY